LKVETIILLERKRAFFLAFNVLVTLKKKMEICLKQTKEESGIGLAFLLNWFAPFGVFNREI